MELRVLNYFLMVAREENITRAAQLLHITQPTLSRQLIQLEQELGVKLFTRSNHHIILTDEGMLLRRRAQEILTLADKTKAELVRDEQTLTGEIAIGCGELYGVSFFMQLLASFHEAYPLVHYQLYSGNADSIKERLEQGLLDLGLLLEPVDIGKYAYARMPDQEQWGILTRTDAPLAERASVTAADLVDTPLIITMRALVQHELANWFGEYYDALDIVATYHLLYNAAIMVQHGIGAALCLKLDSHFDHLRFIPLAPSLEAGSVLVWKKGQAISPAVSALIAHAKKCTTGMTDHLK